MSSARHILTLSCANRPGIVARVSAALFDGGFNILDAQQFDDTETGSFFMRVEFNARERPARRRTLFARTSRPSREISAWNWSMRPSDQRKRVALMVSRFDHCLVDLLYRWRSGEIADGDGRDHRQLSARDLRAHRFRRDPVPLPAGHQADQDGAGGAGLGDHQVRQGRPRRARALHADPVRRASRPSCRAAASTSTTRSCPASRAPSPTTRRTRAASS